MNKKQAVSYYNVKQLNELMKSNGLDHRSFVEKDFNGDYRLKWDLDTSNLPETILAKRVINHIISMSKLNKDHES